jgi:hypothetical protein
MMCLILILSSCGAPSPPAPPAKGLTAGLAGSQLAGTFDPSTGAPLPDDRIVAVYGIVGGVDFNGPASTLTMLSNFLPQLEQIGHQYATLDPLHPVKLAVDLVVNGIQPCSAFPQYCSSWTDSGTMQAYVTFCKQHNLLLFLDLQLGTEPVKDAVTSQYVLPYLEQNSFVELALDTEFHFPNTPSGYAEAAGYPCCLGWMDASEINWALNDMAQISLQYHLPRKVVLVHQWNPAVLPNKDKIQTNPNASLVLQSDGFGAYGNKLGDYQVFVQQDLLEYGGYKLFFYYSDGSTAYDYDASGNKQVQTPQEILQIFPQPLFISYQ